jgi:hypothetical protein
MHARSVLLVALAVLLPSVAFPVGAADDLPPGAIRMPDGTVAVPALGEPPAWWTPDVREKARVAGELGLAYDFSTDEFVDVRAATPTQALVRPGSMIFPDSVFPTWCTAAFTFEGETQISTAGHCTSVGDRVYAAFPAPRSLVATRVLALGITTASVNGGLGNDWALIDVAPRWLGLVDADVAYWGGPCGEHAGNGFLSGIVAHVGHGIGTGTGGTPRAGQLVSLTSSQANYTAETQGGDSGSPVLLLDDPLNAGCAFKALAIHTHSSGVCLRVDEYLATVTCRKYGTRVTAVPGAVDDGDGLPL